MRNKNVLIIIAVVVAVMVVVFVGRPLLSRKPAKKARIPAKTAVKGPAATQAPAKKTITKGKGVLTLKALDSKNKEAILRARIFKAVDSRSGLYSGSIMTNRPQELAPGTYDVEVDTIPQKLYKNIKVSEGRQNVEDLGRITGAINVKVLDSKGKDASYPVRVLYANSNEVVATGVTNRALEIIGGVYDLEIATYPRQLKKGVKAESGREEVWDLGKSIGSLTIKVLDQNKKEARIGTRVTKADTNEMAGTPLANRPVEVLKGVYNVEIASTPRQAKKDVAVNAGEETVIEFLIEVPKPAAPAVPAAPAKKK